MNDKFLKDLNDFQNKAVGTLLEYKGKKIIIKSQKFTGKTMIASKLFKTIKDEVIIYHTGCCPELFKNAKKEFLKVLNDNKNKKISIILDEFYDEDIVNYIKDMDNTTCYLLTNDGNLKIDSYMVFNYYHFYKLFIEKELGEYLNIHQIMNKDREFDKKNEKLRHYSTTTTIFLKEKDIIKEYKMEL